MDDLSLRDLLEPLSKARLLQMGRDLGVGLDPGDTNAGLRNRLGRVLDLAPDELLQRFSETSSAPSHASTSSTRAPARAPRSSTKS